MKKTLLFILVLIFSLVLYSQEKQLAKTRIVTGPSIPELLHLGLSYRIANISQLGFSAGIGPTWGSVWPTLSLEHRLYFGRNNEKINNKTWFCRQGTTFFPSAESPQQFTFNLTVGKDIIFKNYKNGISIDVGVFYLADSGDSTLLIIEPLNLWPALRFQFYFTINNDH